MKRRLFIQRSLGTFIAILSGGQLAVAADPYAKVEVLREDGQGSSALIFKVVPAKGLMVNEEGPWSLTLTPSLQSKNMGESLFGKLKFGKSDFDFKIPGVKVPLKSEEGQTGALDYSMTVFICTTDKSRCYREVVKSTFEWKK